MIEKSTRVKNEIHLSYVLFLAATAALGGLLFGFDIAIITGAGPFLIEHFGLNDLSLGIAFSSLLFGCVLGSAAAGRVTDKIRTSKNSALGGGDIRVDVGRNSAGGQLFHVPDCAIPGRCGGRRRLDFVAYVRLGSLTAGHSGTHGSAVSVFDHSRHSDVVRDQLPAA